MLLNNRNSPTSIISDNLCSRLYMKIINPYKTQPFTFNDKPSFFHFTSFWQVVWYASGGHNNIKFVVRILYQNKEKNCYSIRTAWQFPWVYISTLVYLHHKHYAVKTKATQTFSSINLYNWNGLVFLFCQFFFLLTTKTSRKTLSGRNCLEQNKCQHTFVAHFDSKEWTGKKDILIDWHSKIHW